MLKTVNPKTVGGLAPCSGQATFPSLLLLFSEVSRRTLEGRERGKVGTDAVEHPLSAAPAFNPQRPVMTEIGGKAGLVTYPNS